MTVNHEAAHRAWKAERQAATHTPAAAPAKKAPAKKAPAKKKATK